MDSAHKLKFGALEFGRGFAAAAVVLFHAAAIVAQPNYYGTVPFGGVFGNFNAGVDFFFVLSGFLITWMHWDDLGKPHRLPNYVSKRFIRIYPPYWLIVVPLTLLYLFVTHGGLPEWRDPVNIVMNTLLIPYPMPMIMGVAWTLLHEVFFYLVFALLILSGRRFAFVLPIWAAAIILTAPFELPNFYLRFVLRSYNIEFLIGIATALSLRRWTIPKPYLWAVGGAAAFLCLLLFAPAIQDVSILARLAFGLSAAAFVAGWVEIERSRPLKVPAALTFFGASSYAIYLVHTIVLSFALIIVTRWWRLPPWGAETTMLVLFAISMFAGVLFHLCLERPVLAACRRVSMRLLARTDGGRALNAN